VASDVQKRLTPAGDLAAAFAAARVRLALVAVLLAVAGIGWWWTAGKMRGMDNGPWTGLGTLGWFLAVWIVMMAAMMFPSVAPTIALYYRMTRSRSPLSPLIFATSYLLIWAGAGLVAYLIALGAAHGPGDVFAWDRAGQWIAGGTLIAAAVYEVTPLKDVCLGKCRSPLGFLLGSWRDGWAGALRMGAKNGAWCVGCCWALMASLFALGVMSLVWMAFVAGLIAIEKTLPWRRAAIFATTTLLLVLGILLLTAPQDIPGLVLPTGDSMGEMNPMGS
jgi:predicted metal-binding membrane protein